MTDIRTLNYTAQSRMYVLPWINLRVSVYVGPPCVCGRPQRYRHARIRVQGGPL